MASEDGAHARLVDVRAEWPHFLPSRGPDGADMLDGVEVAARVISFDEDESLESIRSAIAHELVTGWQGRGNPAAWVSVRIGPSRLGERIGALKAFEEGGRVVAQSVVGEGAERSLEALVEPESELSAAAWLTGHSGHTRELLLMPDTGVASELLSALREASAGLEGVVGWPRTVASIVVLLSQNGAVVRFWPGDDDSPPSLDVFRAAGRSGELAGAGSRN